MYTLFKYEGETNNKYTKGDIYGIYQNKWQRVHTFNEWKLLSAINKQKIFLNCSEEMPDGKTLTEFAPFSMLTYSTNQKTKSFNINFIPKNQLLIMKSLFSLNRVNRLLQIDVNTVETNGIIYILITNGIKDENDCITFYTYKSVDENNLLVNEWIPVLKFDGVNYSYINDNFGDLTKHKLSKLEREELDILFANKDNIQLGFAFLFKPTGADFPNMNVLDITIKADIKGRWDSTQLGIDYTYSYLDDSSVTITFKKPGKYKINYFN